MQKTDARRIVLLILMILLAPEVQSVTAQVIDPRGGLPDELRQRAVQTLRDALVEQESWVKVHAAEFLLRLSYPQGVREEFQQELELHGEQPQYRTGIWRVLAKASRTPAEREEYVKKLLTAARDSDAPDRLHAVESLAKLGVELDPLSAEDVAAWANQASDADAVFAQWLLALSRRDDVDSQQREDEVVTLLRRGEALTRLRAAYVLGQLIPLEPASMEALMEVAQQAMEDQPSDEISQLADAHVLAAAWKATSIEDEDGELSEPHDRYRNELQRRAQDSPAVAGVLAGALADAGRPNERDLLTGWLDRSDADLRVSAAWGLLRLDRRRPSAMSRIDWTVLGLYFLGMIVIGLVYARRTQSTDDFLLGGRQMKSWMVGLSLFATLLSTLTYLAMPGEMIRHGPMIIMGIASFPLVAWIVGWFIIPFFMRLHVTSAYEVLETRFGYGGRLVGSIMFLALRFFWMAVILYATTDAVIVPLLGWTSAATPWVCGVLGIITVLYSSLGGLRAVVLTDVIQTGILLSGALLALAVITVHLGGVSVWWPTQWDPSWAPLRFFDTHSPRTLLMAFIATGVWFICTASSDQLAIQRYLATRDVKAARRMFFITLLMNVVSWGLLAILGFALLGFYRVHPEYLADGATIAADADTLFPRFIAVGLPTGLSGLVVAGLLAAAMSSLSSGINSSCAVISVDYVARWRKSRKNSEGQDPQEQASPGPGLKETQVISWSIGAVAVLLSMGAGFVPGNLLDMVYRVANLLVAPLFVLFFMALFVKRATWPATFLGVMASIVVAVLVAFGQMIASGVVAWMPGAADAAETIDNLAAMGVLWIMPLSLVVGIAIGWLGSRLGLGRAAPPLPTGD